MRFLLSGASGFVGHYLTGYLRANGHGVRCLVRHTTGSADEAAWDPDNGQIDPAVLNGIDAVVCMNGASIAGQRWSEAYKRKLVQSRVAPVALLASTLARMEGPPVFVSFSGAGVYGWQDPDVECDESAAPGTTFIAELAKRWEDAALPAQEAGVRVIHPRLGSVMGQGSMLGGLVPVFRWGLGVRLGSGRQAFSWMALDDIGPAILHCIEHGLSGPVNFTAPETVSNAQFTRELAHAVHRPAPFAAPGWLLKMMVGELADEMVHGQHVVPRRLLDSGYSFHFATLDSTLAEYVPRLLQRR